MARTKKPAPDSVWIAIDDGFSAAAPFELLKRGASYPGSHPAVIVSPALFAPAGTTDYDLNLMRLDRYPTGGTVKDETTRILEEDPDAPEPEYYYVRGMP